MFECCKLQIVLVFLLCCWRQVRNNCFQFPEKEVFIYNWNWIYRIRFLKRASAGQCMWTFVQLLIYLYENTPSDCAAAYFVTFLSVEFCSACLIPSLAHRTCISDICKAWGRKTLVLDIAPVYLARSCTTSGYSWECQNFDSIFFTKFFNTVISVLSVHYLIC